ncbi:MAG: RNA polymerase sigma factor [Bacteroidetes bacterium]|nr:RNA polymerase sigma factor [Bacteroidota bacterium]MBS1739097.1 RNA polymerase sigma factor [Bacteroidota bacterium]
MPPYSEQEIIQGCLRGDRVYQQHLYGCYFDLFLKICARYAKCMEDAEQLLNDSFFKIFASISQFNHNGSFEGWMKRIVVNVCLDYLKSRQLRDRMQTNSIGDEQIFSQKMISAEAIQNLHFKELLKTIQTLPTMSKTVFNLYVFEGFSHKNIAQMLDISESTSSWHLHNARHLLQKKLIATMPEKKVK